MTRILTILGVVMLVLQVIGAFRYLANEWKLWRRGHGPMMRTALIIMIIACPSLASATDSQEAICDTAAVFYCDNFELHSVTQNDQTLSSGAYKSVAFYRSKWPNGTGGTLGTGMHIIDSGTTPDGVYLGTKAFEGTYASGNNTGPGYMDASYSPTRSDVYLRWYVKYSSAWEFSSIATKHMEFRLSGSIATPQLMWVATPVAGRATMYPRVFEYYSSSGDSHTFQQNVGTAILGRDTWYCLEVRHKMQTNSTTSDAIIEAWVDGVKILYYPDMIIDNRGGNTINGLLVSHYWNCSTGDDCSGGANDTHPLQYRWIDNIVASTERIGCLGDSSSGMYIMILKSLDGIGQWIGLGLSAGGMLMRQSVRMWLWRGALASMAALLCLGVGVKSRIMLSSAYVRHQTITVAEKYLEHVTTKKG